MIWYDWYYIMYLVYIVLCCASLLYILCINDTYSHLTLFVSTDIVSTIYSIIYYPCFPLSFEKMEGGECHVTSRTRERYYVTLSYHGPSIWVVVNIMYADTIYVSECLMLDNSCLILSKIRHLSYILGFICWSISL